MYFAALFDLLECKRRLMRLSNCVSYVLAAALLLPAGLLAADHNCTSGAPTPESYTHDFAKEADQLLTRVQHQAYRVRTDADGMANSSRFDELDWQTNADQLNNIKRHVDAMGKTLCRLDQIRSAVLPWQRKEIDRITPALVELADTTTSAIKTLSTHQQTFWATNFPNQMADIYKDANRIQNNVNLESLYAKSSTGPSSSSSSTSTGM
jgi:hypothetical protein